MIKAYLVVFASLGSLETQELRVINYSAFFTVRPVILALFVSRCIIQCICELIESLCSSLTIPDSQKSATRSSIYSSRAPTFLYLLD